MLKKPLILSLLLMILSTVLSIVVTIIFDILGINMGSSIAAPAAIAAATYVGSIYTGKYKEELPKGEKIKIVVYYSITQLLLGIGIIVLLNIKEYTILVIAIVSAFFITLFLAAFLYFALGRGCRMKIKELQKKRLLDAPSES